MRAARRGCVGVALLFAAALLVAEQARAGDLKIATTPPGASVEIDGMVIGKTPCKVKYPGGYFHKPHTAFGARLEHALVARFTMPGYVTQELTLTDGPLAWVAVSGKRQGSYFVLKSDHFSVELEPRVKLVEGSSDSTTAAGPLSYHAPDKASELRGSEHAAVSAANRASSTSGGAGSGSGSPSAEASRTGTVSITCDAAAEIFVDGKFVGQAPATLRLASGSHKVEIKAAGRRTWSRDLEVMSDSQIALHPALEPAR